jgi:hypothetical protein
MTIPGMTKHTRSKVYTITFVLLLIPTVVSANAGSPMMWFGILHITFLNALIGFIESMVLKLFRLDNNIWKVVIANYVSMFIGLVFIAPYFSKAYGNDDFWGGNTSLGSYELNGFVAGMITSYLATLIIEYPIFFWALKDKSSAKRFGLAFFIANTVTNVAMFMLYYSIVSRGGHW